MLPPAIMPSIAPELSSRLIWPNLPQPLRLAQLPGIPVALLFGCASSAWTRQRLDDLAKLQRRYGSSLQVAAVLVPRFDFERDPRSIEQLQVEQSLPFPIGLDVEWAAWQQFGIGAWPTILLIDAEGRIQHVVIGDGPIESLEEWLHPMVMAAGEGRRTDNNIGSHHGSGNGSAPLLVTSTAVSATPLCFPTALAIGDSRLYIADTGHHRVLECDHSGNVRRTFGTGRAGLLDGPEGVSAFQRPQGLALLRDTLFVADTGNHALRRIDLRSGDTTTVLGNGRRGVEQNTESGGRAGGREGIALLDQPCGMQASLNRLYIAMTGENCICSYDLVSNRLEPVAGSGLLAVSDGNGIAAAFAQPTSLALRQDVLYVCDAAGSALRAVYLRDGRVQTLLGESAFEFGRVDGPRDAARVQYPCAIALDTQEPVLWILDTGNHRVCRLRLGGGVLSTHELPQPLTRPAGLACSANAVWIANTGAHALLRLDTRDGSLRSVTIGE
ncbi:MAG: redoxin domain-containing protein [Pseudomonadota bacterium]|nr:redoxin domain-containing protein [Pseudomonadota bacterium]